MKAELAVADRSPRIVCNKCDGAGHHKLGEPHANVYDVLSSSWQCTEMIREQLHKRGDLVSPTALVNRLQFLVEYRLVESRPAPRNHRRREWRAR
jgi:hypothetical protein